MIYENITSNHEWITFINICWSIILFVLFFLSFIRSWFFLKQLCTVFLADKPSTIKKRLLIQLLTISVICELGIYIVFCIVFEYYYDYPTIFLINGLSIVVWNKNTWFYGFIEMLIGFIVWFFIFYFLSYIVLNRNKYLFSTRNRIRVGLIISIKNIPLYFFFQTILVFYMHFRCQELYTLESF